MHDGSGFASFVFYSRHLVAQLDAAGEILHLLALDSSFMQLTNRHVDRLVFVSACFSDVMLAPCVSQFQCFKIYQCVLTGHSRVSRLSGIQENDPDASPHALCPDSQAEQEQSARLAAIALAAEQARAKTRAKKKETSGRKGKKGKGKAANASPDDIVITTDENEAAPNTDGEAANGTVQTSSETEMEPSAPPPPDEV